MTERRGGSRLPRPIRGVGLIVVLGLAVLGAGWIIAAAFAWVMR
jgi:hypothetical protein